MKDEERNNTDLKVTLFRIWQEFKCWDTPKDMLFQKDLCLSRIYYENSLSLSEVN